MGATASWLCLSPARWALGGRLWCGGDWRPPPRLLAGTGAAAVGVRFKVKPARSNWQNNSRCPALEIRGSNRGVYFRQGYTKCFSLDDTRFLFFLLSLFYFFTLPHPDRRGPEASTYFCLYSPVLPRSSWGRLVKYQLWLNCRRIWLVWKNASYQHWCRKRKSTFFGV